MDERGKVAIGVADGKERIDELRTPDFALNQSATIRRNRHEKRPLKRIEAGERSENDYAGEQIEKHSVAGRKSGNALGQIIERRNASHLRQPFSPQHPPLFDRYIVAPLFVHPVRDARRGRDRTLRVLVSNGVHDPTRRKFAIAASTRISAMPIVALNRNFSAPLRL